MKGNLCAPAVAMLIGLGAAVSAQAQSADQAPQEETQPAPFDRQDAETAVNALADLLEQNFVFPDKGEAYAKMLRAKLADGAYAGFPDAETFSRQVTADLQAVHPDGHLRMRPRVAQVRPEGNRPSGQAEERQGLVKSGWIAPDIAYVRFDGFPGNELTLDATRAFVSAYGDATTLIIDARENRGGGTDEMDILFPAIFAEPTDLVTMEMREAVAAQMGDNNGQASMRPVAAPEGIVRWIHQVTPNDPAVALATAKVYLLTSKTTFSAGEHLSLSLKRTHRATLVGEATGGGAHFGFGAPLGEGYRAFVPFGRTFDQDTGESWEGTGVAPDIAVPADAALDEVLRREGINISAADALAALDD